MSHSSACALWQRSKALAEVPLPQIVTLTINPAFDVSTSVRKMVPFTKMRCAQVHRDPGGGGINVARVFKRLGIAATAI
jgi:6-phosphofructokinase 2